MYVETLDQGAENVVFNPAYVKVNKNKFETISLLEARVCGFAKTL